MPGLGNSAPKMRQTLEDVQNLVGYKQEKEEENINRLEGTEREEGRERGGLEAASSHSFPPAPSILPTPRSISASGPSPVPSNENDKSERKQIRKAQKQLEKEARRLVKQERKRLKEKTSSRKKTKNRERVSMGGHQLKMHSVFYHAVASLLMLMCVACLFWWFVWFSPLLLPLALAVPLLALILPPLMLLLLLLIVVILVLFLHDVQQNEVQSRAAQAEETEAAAERKAERGTVRKR